MQTLWQDLRYGARMIRKSPGFTAVAVIALALGIGANSAVFSIVNAVLLNPLPLENPDRLVVLWEKVPSQGVDRNEAAVANYLDWRNQNQSFESLAIYTWWSANLGAGESAGQTPERVRGFRVSANLLDTVGIKPVLGRSFQPDEDQPGKDNVAILTYGLWQRRFNGDPNIVGKSVTINSVARTVVGVLPRDVIYPRGAEVLAPLAMTPGLMSSRSSHGNLTVAKLKPGVTLAQAQADLNGIAARLEKQYPETNTGRGVGVYSIVDDSVGQVRIALVMLMCAVAFVLLIACANVANLMLARAAGRTKEFAVRLALGAGRLRIVWQLLIESVLLALLGGGLGVLLAVWGVDMLKASVPGDLVQLIPGFNHLGLNSRVLIYTLVISLLTGILFGLMPALQSSKSDLPHLNEALKEGGGKASAEAGRHRLRRSLVVAEIALSLMLLAGAGLMMKSFLMLLAANPGFNPDNILTMSLTLPTAKYKEPQQRAEFYQELEHRVRALPGVETIGFISHLPLNQSNTSDSFYVEGMPTPSPGEEPSGRHRGITPDYFKVMGIRLIQGRFFSEADHAKTPKVMIVNEALAKRYWPKGDALGKRIRFTGAQDPWMEIVGVVSDVKHEMDKPMSPDYFLPQTQDPWSTMVLVARSRIDPMALAAPIRGEVKTMDADLPVYEIRTMAEVRDRSIGHYQLGSMMFSIFACFALLLAATGIYGVTAYSVSQRTNEIGIRMALGAHGSDVLKLVIGDGMRTTLIGLVIGLLGGFGMARLLGGVMFGVGGTEWAILLGLSLFLGGVSLLACWIPARRATKVDPMIALRCE